jgi:hypothetical protein
MRIRMEITRKFKDPLTRQADEAVIINSRTIVKIRLFLGSSQPASIYHNVCVLARIIQKL